MNFVLGVAVGMVSGIVLLVLFCLAFMAASRIRDSWPSGNGGA